MSIFVCYRKLLNNSAKQPLAYFMYIGRHSSELVLWAVIASLWGLNKGKRYLHYKLCLQALKVNMGNWLIQVDFLYTLACSQMLMSLTNSKHCAAALVAPPLVSRV
jgi:hypothetical protein